MNRSLNEVEALVKRAARGAGLSWGMAEETAKAIRWLASHGLPGAEVLAKLLTEYDEVSQAPLSPVDLEGDGPWRANAGALCPLMCGAALNDCAERLKAGQPIEMAQVLQPLLVVPFAAWAALYLNRVVCVCWQDMRIHINGQTVWIEGPRPQLSAATAAILTCQVAPERPHAGSAPHQRAEVGAEVWDHLDRFAHRTYAPATEASRLLGAGAGLSDQD